MNFIELKDRIKNYKFHFIFSILYLLLTIYLGLPAVFKGNLESIIFCAYLTPGIILFVLFLIRKQQSILTQIIITVISLMTVIPLLFIVFILGTFMKGHQTDFERLKISDNPMKYESVIKDYNKAIHIEHFPPQIPPNAKNMMFSASPSILNGSGNMNLKMELPEKDINELMNKYKGQGVNAIDKTKDWTILENFNEFNRISDFKYSNLGLPSPPNDVKVIVLGGGLDFDHGLGNNYGIGVCKEKKLVVYWYMDF